MNNKLPWEVNSNLKQEYLEVIAKSLLDVFYDVYEQLTSELDNNYTRGTCTFGRQREKIIQLCLSEKYSWLKLTHTGMDITFEINSIPVRFFTDDPLKPKKSGFFKRNQQDQLFLTDDNEPQMWRYIIEKPEFEDQDAIVHFHGYNLYQELVSSWSYGASVNKEVPEIDNDSSMNEEYNTKQGTEHLDIIKPKDDISKKHTIGK